MVANKKDLLTDKVQFHNNLSRIKKQVDKSIRESTIGFKYPIQTHVISALNREGFKEFEKKIIEINNILTEARANQNKKRKACL